MCTGHQIFLKVFHHQNFHPHSPKVTLNSHGHQALKQTFTKFQHIVSPNILMSNMTGVKKLTNI